jgi:uncharacterized Tic20 family protein
LVVFSLLCFQIGRAIAQPDFFTIKTHLMDTLDHFEHDYQPTSDEKTLGILAHILTFVGGFIAPLIIYLVKKDESEYVRRQAIESLNFQISVVIYCVGCAILTLVIIGIFLLIALGILTFILTIIATVKAADGKIYQYPFTIRLIKE